MSVTRDIVEAYRAPRRVMARQLAAGVGEERALAYVMTACFLMFVARLPLLSRQAHIRPEDGEFSTLAGGAFLGAVLMAPLVFYALAALSHAVAKAFGGQGTWLSARLALFWSLLVICPLMLFHGLVAGFIGEGPALTLVNVGVGVVFLWLWISALRVAEAGSPLAPDATVG
ncbi:YIP1 family protein [Aliiroseovarius sp. YM-037]|uniref:YIP1 family protein n=1 Tax=Aliiroseovarius sp. YM-037 TaxID=3341728 RepID=UPI003A80CA16